MKKVSIIIPCKIVDDTTRECLEHCLDLDYDDLDIIVLPDELPTQKILNKKIQIIATGNVKPAVKRNIGMKKAVGTFIASIDSDAYPHPDWLKNAVKYFDDQNVGLVGGPNLTPPDSSPFEKISGYALANYFVLGEASSRYYIADKHATRELPSCNYISRASISPLYDETLLTAEDSKFCFDITKKGYTILYVPDAIVYHHRRNSFTGHVRQMYVYGRDIAALTRKEFSLSKLYYILPTIGLAGFVLGLLLSFFNFYFRALFSLVVFFYLMIILFTSIHDDFQTTMRVWATSIASHFAYGWGWIAGIMK